MPESEERRTCETCAWWLWQISNKYCGHPQGLMECLLYLFDRVYRPVHRFWVSNKERG